MPSSSSSEEDLSKFQEAADSVLYSDTLFTKKTASAPPEQEKSETASLPSLRHVEEEVERIHNELRVTPSFQKHVAKHLSKLIDSQFDITEQSTGDVDSNQTRNILRAKRSKNPSSADADRTGGVRLFGASAVFLSNLNIVPAATRRRKRGHKIAIFSSDSSSEDSDSTMQKLSAAAVSPDWILSGAATKGYAIKEGKVKDRYTINKSGKLVPVKDDVSRGYESLNEMSSSNRNSKKSDLQQVKDDLAVGKLCKREKSLHLESELAASFSSVVSIGSDSQGDIPSKSKKKKKKRKKCRKEHYSEDATTETTEVEDTVEERRKKVKKSKKKCKRRRTEEKEGEKAEVIMEDVTGLIEDAEPRKKKKKSHKKEKDNSFLKKKSHYTETISKKRISKKKMSKKVSHLAEDLSKLMMNPNDAS